MINRGRTTRFQNIVLLLLMTGAVVSIGGYYFFGRGDKLDVVIGFLLLNFVCTLQNNFTLRAGVATKSTSD